MQVVETKPTLVSISIVADPPNPDCKLDDKPVTDKDEDAPEVQVDDTPPASTTKASAGNPPGSGLAGGSSKKKTTKPKTVKKKTDGK